MKGGTVRVEASPAASGVRITVREDGEGIPAEAHGGTIAAATTVGVGTSIQVSLPA
jgi:signal transduction histidine kinase